VVLRYWRQLVLLVICASLSEAGLFSRLRNVEEDPLAYSPLRVASGGVAKVR